MLGGLLYFIATIPYIPHSALILLFFYVLFFRSKKNKKVILYEKRTIYGIIFFIGMATAYFLIGCFDPGRQIEFPYFIPIIFAFLIGASLEEKDLRIIVYLLVIEAIIGIAEFSVGVKTFLPGVTDDTVSLDDENLLYFHRVIGLCKGSSTYALHLLLGLLILHYQRNNIKGYIIFSLIICTAIVFTFTRTVLLVAIPFEIYLIYCFINEKFSGVKYAKHFFYLAVFCGLAYAVYMTSDLIEFQFTRGGEENVMTGRPLIWSNYLKFIKSNLFFGNFGFRTLLMYQGEPNHAHNSFIQIMANVGVPLALYYIFIIIRKINKYNLLYILALFTASMAQYEIFWGISFADIIMFYFLSFNIIPLQKCLK